MPEAGRRRLWAIARKEFLHIIYDFRSLAIIFLLPVVQLFLFGYALTMDLRHVDLAVIDLARTPAARSLVQAFEGGGLFHPFYYQGSADDLDRLFKSRRARAALVIPADFDRTLAAGPTAPVQFLIDAAEANAAQQIRNYATQVITAFNERRTAGLALPFELRVSILFNPNLRSAYFFVPGIIAMILIMISALLTSITITREKETGTLEQILVSPVRPREILLGKVLPYIALAFIDAAVILVLGVTVFAVPFRGNLLVLLLLMTLYILVGLSLGLQVSTRTRTQQVAMMVTNMATLLPTILLAGLIFPIASMPRLLQLLAYVLPARYFLLIVRGIMLKGSSLGELIVPALVLAGMALFLLGLSIRSFRLRLER